VLQLPRKMMLDLNDQAVDGMMRYAVRLRSTVA
jgi:hypothetical protein